MCPWPHLAFWAWSWFPGPEAVVPTMCVQLEVLAFCSFCLSPRLPQFNWPFYLAYLVPLELQIFSLIIASTISSVPFPLSGTLTFPSCICYIFCDCPIILNILFSSFFTFFSLCYSVLGVSVDITSSSLILSSAVSSLLMRPQRHSSFLL